MAAQSIANIVKSSLGPLGLDKMLVDNIGVCLFLHFALIIMLIFFCFGICSFLGGYDLK